jgi:hypothetical protein
LGSYIRAAYRTVRQIDDDIVRLANTYLSAHLAPNISHIICPWRVIIKQLAVDAVVGIFQAKNARRLLHIVIVQPDDLGGIILALRSAPRLRVVSRQDRRLGAGQGRRRKQAAPIRKCNVGVFVTKELGVTRIRLARLIFIRGDENIVCLRQLDVFGIDRRNRISL